jgi:RHS repeat-associated protein
VPEQQLDAQLDRRQLGDRHACGKRIGASRGSAGQLADTLNRLTRELFPDTRRIDYSYDAVGNLTRLRDEGGDVDYAYGPTNLLSSLTEPGAPQTTFDYDDNGNRTATHYPNGVVMNEATDASDQLTSIGAANGAAPLQSLSYTYTQLGAPRDLRQTMIDNIAGKTTSYGYDGLDRLREAQTKTAGGTITEDYVYGYDRNSNRTSEAVTGSDLTRSTTYAYGPANEMTRAGTTTYAYDADGNQTSNSAGQAFVYNAKNQASTYTPLGGGPLSQNFLGEGQAERIAEAATRLQYSQLLGMGTRADAAGTTSFTRDPEGRLIGERRPDGRYYYLFDGLGSITGLTNSTGALVRTYRYEPYGTQRETTGTGPQPAFRFASGYLMPGGLYHFGERYTDTTTGRWTQQDPLDRPSDLAEGNRYLYAGDDPVNLVDPLGLGKTCPRGQSRVSLVCMTPGQAAASAKSRRKTGAFLYDLFGTSFDCLVGVQTFVDFFPPVRARKTVGCIVGALASGQVR